MTKRPREKTCNETSRSAKRPKVSNQQFYSNDLRVRSKIRVLRLLPGQYDDELRGELRLARLDRQPVYTALSYTWGDQSLISSMILNGKEGFQITANLESCLRRLRKDEEAQLYWIDAVCINQANIEERNQQVSLMTLIYSTARDVLIWLGEFTFDRARSPFAAAVESARGNRLYRLTESSFDLVRAAMDKLGRQGDKVWWARMWIVQEFVAARESPVICLGRHRMPWNDFALALKKLWRIGQDGIDDLSSEEARAALQKYEKAALHVSLLDQLRTDTKLGIPRHNKEAKQTGELLAIMRVTSDFNASDPRDKVYALHGLVHRQASGQAPDYAKSLEQVYIDTVLDNIGSTRNLGVLLAEWPRRRNKMLPSWVPDFSQPRDQQSAPRFDDFSASAQICPHVHYKDGSSVLAVRGIHCDEVEEILYVSDDWTTTNFRTTMVNVASLLRRMVDRLSRITLPTTKSSIDAVLDEDGSPASPLQGKKQRRSSACSPATILQKVFEPVDNVSPSGLVLLADRTISVLDAAKAFVDVVSRHLARRALFVTQRGFIGHGPYDVQIGDTIDVLFGGMTPYILRKSASERNHVLIDWAYVAGLMEGQAVRLYRRGKINATTFSLQ